MKKDVVCGMEIDEKKAIKLKYKNKTFYFCSVSCQQTFEKNPNNFLK